MDHIKVWYKLLHPKEGLPDQEALERWSLLVKIVQSCIEKGEIPEAFFFGILVIIPKDDKGSVRVIGLLEVTHKLVSQVINLRMGD